MCAANVSPDAVNPESVRIARFAEAPGGETLLAGVEAIFFESATKKDFASETDRQAFRERWLMRYLKRFPGEAFVAVSAGGAVLGYLIGCLDSAKAGEDFADIGYGSRLAPAVADIAARFPAHLHINMRADARGLGVGQRLIEAFVEHCRSRGVTAIHVVTGAQSRAVGFYLKCGFTPLRDPAWPAPGTLALGLRLS